MSLETLTSLLYKDFQCDFKGKNPKLFRKKIFNFFPTILVRLEKHVLLILSYWWDQSLKTQSLNPMMLLWCSYRQGGPWSLSKYLVMITYVVLARNSWTRSSKVLKSVLGDISELTIESGLMSWVWTRL